MEFPFTALLMMCFTMDDTKENSQKAEEGTEPDHRRAERRVPEGWCPEGRRGFLSFLLLEVTAIKAQCFSWSCQRVVAANTKACHTPKASSCAFSIYPRLPGERVLRQNTEENTVCGYFAKFMGSGVKIWVHFGRKVWEACIVFHNVCFHWPFVNILICMDVNSIVPK